MQLKLEEFVLQTLDMKIHKNSKPTKDIKVNNS